MMRSGIFILVYIFCVSLGLKAQTADVISGCKPLNVIFEAPENLSEYFWDFQDGNTPSMLANPERTFYEEGTYEVKLYEGAAGAFIGSVIITVFPDVTWTYDINIPDICFPRTYEFSVTPQASDSVEVTDILWTFGNGEVGMGANTTVTYELQDVGNRTIGLELTTQPANCNISAILKTIEVERELTAFFEAKPAGSCDVPAIIEFVLADIFEDATYTWDFGDGSSGEGFTNQSHTYEFGGDYTVTLSVQRGECVATYETIVVIGQPFANVQVPDTLCIDIDYDFVNASPGETFIWTFDESAVLANGYTRFDRSPRLSFRESGWHSVRMLSNIVSFENCVVDTTLQVYVQDPRPDIILDPYTSCMSPKLTNMYTSQEYATYIWNGVEGGPSNQHVYVEPERDSMHVNGPIKINASLVVVTEQGCVGVADSSHFFQFPDAAFYPSERQGCAPHTVEFISMCESAEPIIRYSFTYGNGDMQTFTDGATHTYTFTEPGTYPVRLIIENEVGCIDTSRYVIISVGEKREMEFDIDETKICLGDSVVITPINLDPAIDDYFIITDDGRSHYCDGVANTVYGFDEPGRKDIVYNAIDNGCENQITLENQITVQGPKAKAWYMINCEDPLTVMFADSSVDNTSVLWTFEPGATSTEHNNTYTFSQSGDYKVYLEAYNANNDCPPDRDSIIVHVRQLQAVFELEPNLCRGDTILLDASNSIDVDSSCYKGYTWFFPKQGRPRKTHNDSIYQAFEAKDKDVVSLVVEDINGCTDTLSQQIDLQDIQADMILDESICFPIDMSIWDNTQADTTIANWLWEYKIESDWIPLGNSQNINSILDHKDLDKDSMYVRLKVTDVVGCTDEKQVIVNIYEPELELDSILGICVHDTLVFMPDITAGEGLFYEWYLADSLFSNAAQPLISVDTAGLYMMQVSLVEDSTGCSSTQDFWLDATNFPEAEFFMEYNGLLLLDSNATVCYPGIIKFVDFSEDHDEQLDFEWYFYRDSILEFNSFIEHPTQIFGGGQWEAQLRITSEYGCQDSISAPFRVIQTFGNLEADNNVICRGDSLTLMLVDTANVASWSVDMGDGVVIYNQDPITYPVGATSPEQEVKVILTLQNDGHACEQVETIPITVIGRSTTISDTLFPLRGEEISLELLDTVDQFDWIINHPSLICPECDPPIVRIDTASCVMLEAQKIDGCDLSVFAFTVIPREPIEIPNLFTPNGDNHNDFFNYVELYDEEKGSSVEEVLKFEVYDRWGQKVYDNESPDRGWNGLYKGNPAPAEVYGYMIQVRFKGGATSPLFKGDVTLLR